MKILIIGANGQLGRDCQEVLGKEHTVFAKDLPELDATKREQVLPLMEGLRPDVVLNCAAFTRVDDCETQKDLAYAINSKIPFVLALLAKKFGAHLIHISTDYVFDGKKYPYSSYVETDETRPLSVYGESKLAGEHAVEVSEVKHAILRTAWLYGRHGKNFPKAILRKALQNQEISVVNDQYGSPTWSYRLAEQIKAVVEWKLEGTFHTTGDGFTTWFDFASLFLKEIDIPHSINPCSTEEYPTPARRPKNSILDNRNLKGIGLNFMGSWEDGVKAFVVKHRTELIEECKHK